MFQGTWVVFFSALILFCAGGVREDGRDLLIKGKTEEAAMVLRTYLAMNPEDGVAWLYLGHALQGQEADTALQAYLKAVNILPDTDVTNKAQALTWTGVMHRRGSKKDISSSLQYFSLALALDPRNNEAHNHAATSYSLLHEVGHALRHIMASEKRDCDLLTEILLSVEDYKTLLQISDECLAKSREEALMLKMALMSAIASRALGLSSMAYQRQGEKLLRGSSWDASMGRMVRKARDNWEALRGRRGILREEIQKEARAIISNPESHRPILPIQLNQWEQCARHLEEFEFPCHAELQYWLQDAHLDYSRNGFSTALFSNVMLSEPLHCLTNPSFTGTDCRWAATVRAARTKPSVVPLERSEYEANPSRLRVALFTSDWAPTHPMRRLVQAFLEHTPRHKVHLTLLYQAVEDNAEELRAALALVEDAVDLSDLTVDEAASLIRNLLVHVYLDCTGQTGHGRHEIMLQDPAPVLISWGGQPGTTGNRGVYVVADRWTVPLELARSTMTEWLIYLPGTWLITDHVSHYKPPLFEPPYPGIRGDFFKSMNVTVDVTAFVYGTFSRPEKWDRMFMDAVCIILERTGPTSVFLYFSQGNAKSHHAEDLWQRRCGLSSQRFIRVPTLRHGRHLEAASAVIDVALDTPLYNGGLTAVDMVFAGVPLVTMAGSLNKFTQRMAGSVLRAADVSELIAPGFDEYIELAVRLREDVSFATSMRARLRSARENPDPARQPLFQASYLVSLFTDAMRLAYGRWHQKLPQHDILVDVDWYRRISETLELVPPGGRQEL